MPDATILLGVLHDHFDNGKSASLENTNFFLVDPVSNVQKVVYCFYH